jgi:hypothetical protein
MRIKIRKPIEWKIIHFAAKRPYLQVSFGPDVSRTIMSAQPEESSGGHRCNSTANI